MGDPRRIFGQGTPEEVTYFMQQTWDHCSPTFPRVDEGIRCLEGHLKLIFASNGRMVPDIELKRHDRREVCADGKLALGQL
jgi:hypothetical protein